MQIRENTLFNLLIAGFLISIIIGNGIYFLGPRLNQDIEIVPAYTKHELEIGNVWSGSSDTIRVINRQTTSVDTQLTITDLKIVKKEVCTLEVCRIPEDLEDVPNVTIRLENRSVFNKIPPFHGILHTIILDTSGNPADEIEDVFRIKNFVQLNHSLITDGKEFRGSLVIVSGSENLDIKIGSNVLSLKGSLGYRVNRIKHRYEELKEELKYMGGPEYIFGFFFLPWGEYVVYGELLLGSPWIFLWLPFKPLTILMALVLGKVLKNKNKATVVSIGIYYLWWILIFIFIGWAMSQSPLS